MMQGAVRRMEREQDARIWLAHTTAGLTAPRKGFPKLEDMLRPKKKAAAPDEDRMFQIARKWNAAVNLRA